MKAKITKTDLKKALAHGKWSPDHCLIAQTGKRLKLEGWWAITDTSEEAAGLMSLFDRSMRRDIAGVTDEDREMNLTLLELVLPMEIEF